MEDCKQSMKVLFVTHYSGYMGANRSLLQLVNGLKTSFDIAPLVVLPGLGEFSDRLQKENIPFIVMKNYYSLYVNDGRWSNLIHSIKGIICEMLNVLIAFYFSSFVLRKERISLVHTNTSATNIGAYLAFFLQVKHIWHIREFLVLHYGLMFPWGRTIQRCIVNRLSDKVIPISLAVKRFLLSFIPESKIRLVYNGFSITPLVRKRQKEDGLIGIVLVGLIHPSKNQKLVVEAINSLLQKGVSHFHLTIVGNPDPLHIDYYESIIDYIKLYKLEPYITFAGYVSDVQSILSTMHIGILASENEAFGRVTVEYMLNGLTPIALKSGGSIEIITDGIDGFLFEDVEQLANILYSLITERNTITQISNAAYKSAANRFSISNTISELYHCYIDVLN